MRLCPTVLPLRRSVSLAVLMWAALTVSGLGLPRPIYAQTPAVASGSVRDAAAMPSAYDGPPLPDGARTID